MNLKRYPYYSNDPLQAWDAGDELLVKYLEEKSLLKEKVIVINDAFGAISKELSSPITYTDSYVSYRGIKMNTEERVSPLNELESIPFDGVREVVIKLPKNLSFFEDILSVLSQKLPSGTHFVFSGMVKHMASGHFDLIAKCIGETKTSLAEKKARLIFANLTQGPSGSPYPLKVKMDGFEKEIINFSNLFSREKLDIGTRFMLENIPKGFSKILDLGCGNGLLGIKAKQQNPAAQISFADESAMAIKSAKVNFSNYFPEEEGEFFWTNCFEEGKEGMFDLILCNPPFHQNNTIGDFIALQMFKDAHRSLQRGGTLRVVGNSHLGYQMRLKQIFGNSKIIKTNSKFMIVDAVKS